MPTGSFSLAGGASAQRGFTYLLLLFTLALGGVALAALGESERLRVQREREVELKFRGQAIADALARYADRTPVGSLPLAPNLEALLVDKRFPTVQRHLRQLYADPFTGRADWELILGHGLPVPSEAAAPLPATPASGVIGVRSRSSQKVLSSPTPGRPATARDWVFMAPLSAGKPSNP